MSDEWAKMAEIAEASMRVYGYTAEDVHELLRKIREQGVTHADIEADKGGDNE